MRSLVALLALATTLHAAERPRARDAGVLLGTLAPGPLNAITDVAGVKVGHATVVRGENVRTGVTAILPHDGNLFRDGVPAAIFVGNGFGKLMGSTQVRELGEIETPILLTSTLNVPRVADALLDYMLALPGNEDVRSINVVVGETNDGTLNDIRLQAATTPSRSPQAAWSGGRLGRRTRCCRTTPCRRFFWPRSRRPRRPSSTRCSQRRRRPGTPHHRGVAA